MKRTGKKTFKVIKFFVAVVLASFFCLPASADSSYIVKKGDTLYSISRRYQLTVGELRTANNLSENDILKTGQKLIIPSADISNAAALSAASGTNSSTAVAATGSTKSYTVQKGDTLYGIARKSGLKLPELLSLNNMGTNVVIKTGQKLIVGGNQQGAAQQTAADSGTASANVPVTTGDSQLLWPVESPEIVYVKGKVSGVELSAKKNEAVKSIRSGTVMYTGMYRGYGNVVFVESKTGLIYAYSWLGSVSVKRGDYVVCGDTVGTAGKDPDTGRSRLTFMVFQNGMPMDPVKAPRG